jgi:hypothetical protein
MKAVRRARAMKRKTRSNPLQPESRARVDIRRHHHDDDDLFNFGIAAFFLLTAALATCLAIGKLL